MKRLRLVKYRWVCFNSNRFGIIIAFAYFCRCFHDEERQKKVNDDGLKKLTWTVRMIREDKEEEEMARAASSRLHFNKIDEGKRSNL
jgi:hypothetical protein